MLFSNVDSVWLRRPEKKANRTNRVHSFFTIVHTRRIELTINHDFKTQHVKKVKVLERWSYSADIAEKLEVLRYCTAKLPRVHSITMMKR